MKRSAVIALAAIALLLAQLPGLSGTASAATMSHAEFIQLVGDLAVADYPNSKILPSVVIAQAIEETGWGSSQVMMNNNALFGVKATASWTGGFYSAVTGEYYGEWTTTTALFRAYPSLQACIEDHARILSLSRYNGVVGGTDYKTVCGILQSGGYATNPNYASNLISIIENNNLTAYDNRVIITNGYDADAAVAYATKWSITDVEKRNPDYSKYEGADCANFVSQCLYAGGLSTDAQWYKDSYAWINANGLRQYLINRGFSGKDYANGGSGAKLDLSTVSAGDIVWCSGASGTYGHVMIVSKVTSTDYMICGHTKERCNYTYTNYKITYHIKMNGRMPIPIPTDDPVPDLDYIVHIDHPSGTYDGSNGVEVSGWVASKIRLTSAMAQSSAIVGGQMNLTNGLVDASDELNAAGYGAYPYKARFRGVIPRAGLTANTTYSFSVWMDLADGRQTQVTTSTFRVGNLDNPPVVTPTPTHNPYVDMLDCIVHIDSPTGTYSNNNVEISGWIASLKPIGACMVESEAIPLKQDNLTSSLRDASAELDGAGYSKYPYKYRYSGVIPKYGMKSNTDYELKVWFSFADGTSSGVTKTTFHTGEMKNTEIVITSPKGGSNYANTSNVPITGYILSDSGLWYILCQAGNQQFSLDATDDASLASSKGYQHAYKFSKTIRCDSLPANSNPTIEIWTKNAGDGVEVHKQVTFTTGSRVYGSLDDYKSNMDSPSSGMRATGDFEVSGWVAAHAPIGYVMLQAVPTDGSEGGFQIGLNLEATSELDSGYSDYQYRARYRGIVEFGTLKSNKTYKITIWCGLVGSDGHGNQRFLSGCDRTFTTGTVTVPVYTNTFNANGGTGAPAAVKKTWHQSITLPTTVPTRIGYTFLGWAFKADAYEALYLPGATFNEETNHTLYAVWEPARMLSIGTAKTTASAAIAFGGQKAAFKLSPKVTTNYRLTAANGVLAVYNASGALLGSGSSINVNLTVGQVYTLTAGFSSATQKGSLSFNILEGYPVTFDAEGGTGAPAGTLYQYYNEALTLPAQEPSREVVLTLNPNGGTLATTTFTLPVQFMGWTADEGVIEGTVFNAPTTLTAVWDYPTVGQLETPVLEGYVLSAWVDENLTVADSDYIVNRDVTLIAVWQVKQYSIFYDLNGGEGEIGETQKVHGYPAAVTTLVPTREAYDFMGWALSGDAAEAAYQPADAITENQDMTLYAVWKLSRIPVSAFSIPEQVFTLSAGETYQIIVTVEPEDADLSSIAWESLKPEVASVDENGLVTGVSEGTAMIKAACSDTGATVYTRATVTARKVIQLPDQLTRIKAKAFMGDTSIVVVRVGANVRSIGACAFKNCSNLKEIWIPESVTEIALDAFDGCPKLTIYGTEGSTAWEIALLKGIAFEVQ